MCAPAWRSRKKSHPPTISRRSCSPSAIRRAATGLGRIRGSTKDVADFFNGLVDEKTGKKIPVILRYPHEMDGNWFWWGRGWSTAEEFRRFCRMEADYLREKCPTECYE